MLVPNCILGGSDVIDLSLISVLGPPNSGRTIALLPRRLRLMNEESTQSKEGSGNAS